MPFQPVKHGQFEPSTSTSPKDCIPATTALLIERATAGAKRPDHADIRRLSGAPGTRGLYPSEAVTAAAHYGVTITAVYGLSRDAARDTVAGGQASGFSIDCAVTVHTKRATNTYTGPHQVFANEYRWWPGGAYCDCEKRLNVAHAEYLVDDPGTTSAGFLWWSADLLYRAAESRTNGHGINLLVAPDTEGSTRTGVGGPIYDSPFRSSKVKGTVKAGQKYVVTSTFNGGGWPRDDGTTAMGWWRLAGDLYVPGKGLK